MNCNIARKMGLSTFCFHLRQTTSDIPSFRKRECYIKFKTPYYPVSYDILLEIENDIVDAWKEMTKMTWVRCPLKVVVTYFHKHGAQEDMIVNSFKTIIAQSNALFKENPETEYLLLLGYDEGKKLNWKSFIFNSEGEEDLTNNVNAK